MGGGARRASIGPTNPSVPQEGVTSRVASIPCSAGMVDTYHLDLLHAAGKLLHSWTINNASLVHGVLVGGAVGGQEEGQRVGMQEQGQPVGERPFRGGKC